MEPNGATTLERSSTIASSWILEVQWSGMTTLTEKQRTVKLVMVITERLLLLTRGRRITTCIPL